MRQLVESIRLKQKGHWALIETAHQESARSNFVSQVKGIYGVKAFIEIDCSSRPMAGKDEIEALRLRIKEAVREAKTNDARAICCVLSAFHHLTTEVQVQILSMTRGIREESFAFDIALVTVVIGSWNKFRMQQTWKTLYSSVSPCPDGKNISFADPYSAGELKEFLLDNRLISEFLQPLDQVMIEAMFEFTGGDNLLIGEIVSILKLRKKSVKEYSSTVDDITCSESVMEEVQNRLQRVSESGRDLLVTMLLQGMVVVEESDPDVEDLRLAGFIRIERANDIALAVINSPLIELVFRANWEALQLSNKTILFSNDLLTPSRIINGHAYQLVLEIETALRNMMVQYFTANTDEGWKECAKRVKVSKAPAEIYTEELYELGMKLFTALYPDVDVSKLESGNENDSDRQEDSHQSGKIEKQSISILDAAGDWKDRVEKASWIGLAEDSLTQYLTTGNLMHIYLGKGACTGILSQYFHDKQHATTFFTKFLTLRSAVAHNHSLNLSAVATLMQLKRELFCRFERVLPI